MTKRQLKHIISNKTKLKTDKKKNQQYEVGNTMYKLTDTNK